MTPITNPWDGYCIMCNASCGSDFCSKQCEQDYEFGAADMAAEFSAQHDPRYLAGRFGVDTHLAVETAIDAAKNNQPWES